jgi:hypothetical protein
MALRLLVSKEELKEAQRMVRKLSVAGALVALSLAGSGCVVSGSVRTSAYVEDPSMVMVEPGVYVVTDYDRPVFYTDGYYWLYSDSYWLRSYTYSGGFVRVRSVPYGVRRIHRPYAYVRYRPRGTVRYYHTPRRGERVRVYDRGRYDRRDYRTRPVRDHRSYDRRSYDRNYDRRRAAPVRDHRTHRRAAPARAPSRDHRSDRRRSRDDDDDDDRRDRRRR